MNKITHTNGIRKDKNVRKEYADRIFSLSKFFFGRTERKRVFTLFFCILSEGWTHSENFEDFCSGSRFIFVLNWHFGPGWVSIHFLFSSADSPWNYLFFFFELHSSFPAQSSFYFAWFCWISLTFYFFGNSKVDNLVFFLSKFSLKDFPCYKNKITEFSSIDANKISVWYTEKINWIEFLGINIVLCLNYCGGGGLKPKN